MIRNNLARTENIFKKEHEQNFQVYYKIIEKIEILEANSFVEKVMNGCIFAMPTYFLSTILLPNIVGSGSFLFNLASPLIVGSSALIGIITGHFITKKKKVKEKLMAFSKAKSQRERNEELLRCKIAKEKIIASDRILDKCEEKILLSKYVDTYSLKPTEDNTDNRSKEEIVANIENLNSKLKEEQEKVNTAVIKRVLKEKRPKTGVNIFDTIIYSLFSAVGALMIYGLPSITCHRAVDISSIFGTIEFFGPMAIGAVIGTTYYIKKIKDETVAFTNVNKEQGENALTNEEMFEERYFGENLENSIEEVSKIRLQLESEKRKLEAIEDDERKVSEITSRPLSLNLIETDLQNIERKSLSKKRTFGR